MNPPGYGSDPISPNTTYVQADPATFRAVVQKLTGASEDPSAERLPLSLPTRFAHPKPDMGPRRPVCERRPAARKLELKLAATPTLSPGAWLSPSLTRHRCGSGEQGVSAASPVSTLEFLARGSPRTPMLEEEEEEERAIAEKGFYLRSSPLTTPRPGSDPPELLHLFPLHSPRDTAPTS